MLRKHYGYDGITVVRRRHRRLDHLERQAVASPGVSGVEADLATVMFGYNEKATKPEDRGVMTKAFTTNLVVYLEEVAGVMKRPPACVVLATIPGNGEHWETLDCYAEGVRGLGKSHPNLTVADINGHFKRMGFEKFKTLMADGAHPNVQGQREMANVVFEAITGEKAPE